jgi:magnesium-transporting ATPase (P-type)
MSQLEPYLLSAEQLAVQLGTDLDNGLGPDRASELLATVGRNELENAGGVNVLRIFLGQIFNAMVRELRNSMKACHAHSRESTDFGARDGHGR